VTQLPRLSPPQKRVNLIRVNEELSFRAEGEETFSPMGQRVKRRGRGWKGKGEWSEHGERMSGTVLIRWEKDSLLSSLFGTKLRGREKSMRRASDVQTD
jgi:hypothetical protein